ncbi:MAG: YkvA family protein [Hoeflea sp.]|uniref:YkvA family protein n=1 Tax=Hoeflea sp. TaxID=1940281 RepID=UPI002731AF1E|nr:YkvA family protein [Hoeflea sp.]MDP2122040.1 YkvA family protein [Hoeflea sp.]MDZ7600405.1 YkvA family protein [Hoeflea sp.]
MSTLEGEILEPDQESGSKTRGADESSVRAGFWRTFRKAAGQIPFAEDLVAAYYCALDPQTPGKSRAVLLGALAYFIMPVDAIPDVLAFVGFSDDIAVLTLAFATVRSNLTEAHRIAARRSLADFAAGNDPEPKKTRAPA